MAGILKVDQVQSDSNLSFQVAGANVAYMNSTGLQMTGGSLSLGGTTIIPAAGQIAFPATQNSSSNANTLDDYEEGTYTATITTGTSGTVTLSSSVDLLQYTKIGRLVTFTGRVLVTSVSSPVGSINFTLPFACQNGGAEQSGYQALSCITHGVNLEDVSRMPFFEASAGSSYATVYQVRDNASWVVLLSSVLTGSGSEYFYIAGSYITD
jgi:hypothetical protein